MSPAERERLIEMYVEEFINNANYGVKHEIFAPNFVDHTPILGLPGNADGLEQAIRALHTGFPDRHAKIDEIVHIGDNAELVRFTIEGTSQGMFGGMPPTGRHVKYTGMSFGRYSPDGHFSEMWTYRDDLGYLQQMGLIPAAVQPATTEQPAHPAM